MVNLVTRGAVFNRTRGKLSKPGVHLVEIYAWGHMFFLVFGDTPGPRFAFLVAGQHRTDCM
jgi:hypothetical protein